MKKEELVREIAEKCNIKERLAYVLIRICQDYDITDVEQRIFHFYQVIS